MNTYILRNVYFGRPGEIAEATKDSLIMLENRSEHRSSPFVTQTIAASVVLRASLEPPAGIPGLVRQGSDAIWRAVFYLRRSFWFMSRLISLAMVVSATDEDAVGV
jgi:hypothetical protein